METSTTILLGVGAVGVGYVLYRNWKQGQPVAQQSPCLAAAALASKAATIAYPEDPQAGAQVTEAAKVACPAWDKLSGQDKVIAALSGVAGLSFKYGAQAVQYGLGKVTSAILGSHSIKDDIAANVARNGDVVARVDPRIPSTFINRNSPGVYQASMRTEDGRLGLDIPLRHANGCVPYSGHPDAGKCVQGTKMLDNGPTAGTKAMGSGTADDPTTGRIAAGAKFPLLVPAGAAGYWERGVAKVCAGSLVQDHRTGRSGFLCNTTVPIAPTNGAGTATVGGAQPIDSLWSSFETMVREGEAARRVA